MAKKKAEKEISGEKVEEITDYEDTPGYMNGAKRVDGKKKNNPSVNKNNRGNK